MSPKAFKATSLFLALLLACPAGGLAGVGLGACTPVTACCCSAPCDTVEGPPPARAPHGELGEAASACCAFEEGGPRRAELFLSSGRPAKGVSLPAALPEVLSSLSRVPAGARILWGARDGLPISPSYLTACVLLL